MNKLAAVAPMLAIACASAPNAQVLEREFLLNATRPVYITTSPLSDRLFVVEQPGRIRSFDVDGTGAELFLDVASITTGGTSGGDERGLLGLAFHPDPTENRFFINHTTTIDGQLTSVVARYSYSGGGGTIPAANPLTRFEILSFDQPVSNHNAGWLDFSPVDGYLYLATGDGGGSGDTDNNAQNTGNILGNILRIDVTDVSPPYEVPADNPFVNDPGALDEIWAYGLRNPWRSSFDRETGDLWIADVGQGAREEVNYQPASSNGGENYGWRCREGFIAFNTSQCDGSEVFTDPVHDYVSAPQACSVVGGYVYRGCALGEELQGQYIFGDYCTGEVWALDPDDNFSRTTLADFPFGLSSFGEDADGELLVAFLFENSVYRLVNPAIGDEDGDGIPDTCETCDADVNGDLRITISDVLFTIARFGTDDLVADANGDMMLTIADVLFIIARFGDPC